MREESYHIRRGSCHVGTRMWAVTPHEEKELLSFGFARDFTHVSDIFDCSSWQRDFTHVSNIVSCP